METHIQSVIHGLGFFEDGEYFPEPDCFENIRDLIGFLRFDSESGLARRLCNEWNIVMNDLIPIIKSNDISDSLFDVALRLTVNLCQPTITVFRGKAPEDREAWRVYWEMERNLRKVKAAFADIKLMEILHAKVSAFFDLDWMQRNETTKMVIERIFVLLTYVLSIGNSDDSGENEDVGTDEGVTLAVLKSGLGGVITRLVSKPKEHDFHLSMLHLVALIVKPHEASEIVAVDGGRTQEQKTENEEQLRKCIMRAEEKKLEARRRLGTRHTSFAGSYVMKGLRALNPENDLVLDRAVKKKEGLDHLYERKVKKRQAKNRRPFEGSHKTQSAGLEMRRVLKQFVGDVLQCYNRLMHSCRDIAFSGRTTSTQRNADIHYFLVMRFFMEYTRIAALPSNMVSETLGKEGFHHVQTQIDNYLEMAQADRREGKTHGLRAQYAVCAYKELLCTLRCMMDKGSTEEKEEAQATCKHIMIMEEYRDLSSAIMRKFMPGILSKTFLRNLVLANHVYIALLEKCSKAGSLLKVSKRQKVRRKPRRRVRQASSEQEPEVDLEEVWESISEPLSDVVNGVDEPSVNVNPIDVRLQVDDDVHRELAALLVQKALREERVNDAVGLYRAARTIWPSEGSFGTNDMSNEEEFIGMRMIFFADLSEVESVWKKAYDDAYSSEKEDDMNNDLVTDGYGSEEESDGATRYITKEIDFNFDEYVLKFARADILKWYIFLLNECETNSDELNRALVKLLHRVAFDLHQAPRLFQLSLFRILARLTERFRDRPKSAMKTDRLFRIYELGFHVLKRFWASYALIGASLMPELLFWKGPKECHDIEFGYGSYNELDKKTSKEMLWSEELDGELRSLHDEYVAYEDKPEGIDVVEFIESNLSRDRSRRQIIRELKELGLDTFGAKINLGMLRTGPKSTMWPADQVELMVSLVDQYKSLPIEEQSEDMVEYIRERLPEQYSRARIIKQLKYNNVEWRPAQRQRKNPKVWTTELLIELKNAQVQYGELTEKPSCGLVDYVRIRLSSKRTRKDIRQKLLENGCDAGLLETTKSVRKRPKPVKENEGENTRSDSSEEDADVLAVLEGSTRSNSPEIADENRSESPISELSEKRAPSIVLSEGLDLDDDDLDEAILDDKPETVDEETNKAEIEAHVDSDDEDDELVVRRTKRAVQAIEHENEDTMEGTEKLHSTPPRKRRAVLSDDDDD